MHWTMTKETEVSVEQATVDEETQEFTPFGGERRPDVDPTPDPDHPEQDPKPVPETPEVEPGRVDEPGETPAVEPGPVDDPEGDDDDD